MKSLAILLLLGSINTYSQELSHMVGDPADAIVPTQFGVVLMGGSTDVDEAFQWMINKARDGDFVIIRASGSNGYNQYVYDFGQVNSVETLVINSIEKANLPETARRLREADALFIAGGDQSNYVKFWSNSAVSEAINYLVNEKKIPIGGTSAGCAVLSDIIFDALHDTVTSDEALANPYDEKVSISKSFIRIPILKNVISDQHYSQRKRQGRHMVFLARMKKDMGLEAKGIAVDEKTAVCIEANGDTRVFGSNKAFFLTSDKKVENCSPGAPLHWYQNQKAVAVNVYAGSKEGTIALNLLTWTEKKPHQYWYVEKGVLKGN